MGKKAAATLGLATAAPTISQALVAEAPALRLGPSTEARPKTRSRIASFWSHQRDLSRQRAELSKSHDAGLGRDTGCRV
jgi:hypothetical protein